MNAAVSLAIFALILGLSVQNVSAWRRRRRVSYGLHKRQLETEADTVATPSLATLCSRHGEYVTKQGRILPSDSTGKRVNNLNCNNKFCWKGPYCWHCQSINGDRRFKRISQDEINNIVCEDVQCLYGSKDTGLAYYTTNSSRSVPTSNGPFTCNSYMCMSGENCWKCRLNEETEHAQVIEKGFEFNSRVTCCPIPKMLFSLKGSQGGHYKASKSNLPIEDYGEDVELNIDSSITIEFQKKELVTGISLQSRTLSSFFLSYSEDGQTWTTYEEYHRKAVVKSTTESKSQTLFKPLMLRYLRLTPASLSDNVEVAVNIYGCDTPSAL